MATYTSSHNMKGRLTMDVETGDWVWVRDSAMQPWVDTVGRVTKIRKRVLEIDVPGFASTVLAAEEQLGSVTVLDPKMWDRGHSNFSFGVASPTQLINGEGCQCCLGFLGLDCGIPRHDLALLSGPEDVDVACDDPRWQALLSIRDLKPGGVPANSPLAMALIGLNDAASWDAVETLILGVDVEDVRDGKAGEVADADRVRLLNLALAKYKAPWRFALETEEAA
jgi:hypothetical protein